MRWGFCWEFMSRSLKNLDSTEPTFRRLLLLALVYLIPAFQALLPVEDPDLWWHLRTGQWIIEHGRVPLTDPFSAYGAGKPWVAYSWLYELFVYYVHQSFGLVGIVWTTVILSLLIALALHVLVRMARLPFLAEVGLLALALGSMKPVFYLRSWLFSILFFTIELILLFHVRRSGKHKPLLLLPLLFVLWANLHIQFVYGLALLGLFMVEGMIGRLFVHDRFKWGSHGLSLKPVLVILAMSVLATFITPYHYRLFSTVFEYVSQTGAFQNVGELHPMFFRSPQDWFVLVLVLVATFALGRQGSIRPLPLLLLAMAVLPSFRARRDTWLVVLAALFVIGDCYRKTIARDSFALTRSRILLLAAVLVVALFFMSRYRGISETELTKHVEKIFPVKAVAFAKENGLTGPLYNHFDWGGYLIWSLPDIPVSMDGRTNLHGDDRIARSLSTWAGQPGWDSDAELTSARIIVADVTRPLTALLRSDRRFKVGYEDTTAVIFVPSLSRQ